MQHIEISASEPTWKEGETKEMGKGVRFVKASLVTYITIARYPKKRVVLATESHVRYNGSDVFVSRNACSAYDFACGMVKGLSEANSDHGLKGVGSEI